MYRLLLLLLFFYPVGVATAAPALVVERLTHDFGDIFQGDTVIEVFRFHNAGDQVLKVGNLRSSCGCTQALLTSNRLEPGAIGEMQLKFNSRGFKGPVQKKVSFSTNDPTHPSVAFVLRGRVKPELFIQPDKIRWGVVPKGTPLTAELQIINDSASPVVLHQPKVTNAAMVAQLSALIIAPGEQVTLSVAAEFPAAKNRLAGYVLVNTDLVSVPQLRVSASARLAVD